MSQKTAGHDQSEKDQPEPGGDDESEDLGSEPDPDPGDELDDADYPHHHRPADRVGDEGQEIDPVGHQVEPI